MSNNKSFAQLLTNMGHLLEIQGENVFKIRAYFKAADNISSLSEDIKVLVEQGRTEDIPGVGKAIRDKMIEYVQTGHVSSYERLIKEIPETVLDVIHVPTVGPKKAKLFYNECQVTNLDQLKAAAEDGSLLKLAGVKEKTVQNILDGIRIVRAAAERITIVDADLIASEFIHQLQGSELVKRIEIAGSLRRGKETIGDIDLLVCSSQPQSVMELFVSLPQVTKVLAHGETKASVLTDRMVQVDLRVVEDECFGAAQLYFTGSKNFNVKLRQIAIKQNKKVSEYGIFDVSHDKEHLLPSRTEEECLKQLNLPYIAPELREDISGDRLWTSETLPKLVELKDIKGELHVHSTWSDGKNSIREMVAQAQANGYEYLAISDHSERLKVANGLSREDFYKKKKEIEQLNAELSGFRVLMGSEVEIDSEGNLDYNADILADLDFCIAAIHTGFEQSRDQLTKRIIKACQSKYVHAIAHPTGVHIGKRDPYDIDFKEICRVAVDTNTCLEINSFPVRLDLNSANIYFAREQGVKFVINTDSHRIDHMKYMKYGIGLARRAWLEQQNVLNTLPLAKLLKALQK